MNMSADSPKPNIQRLSSFRVKDHTVFTDSGQIKIGNITVFTGKNNIGKSSIIKALSLLSYYANTLDKETLGPIFRRSSDKYEKLISVECEFQFNMRLTDAIFDKEKKFLETNATDVNLLRKYIDWLDALKSQPLSLAMQFTFSETHIRQPRQISLYGFDFPLPHDTAKDHIEEHFFQNIIRRILDQFLSSYEDFSRRFFYFDSHRVAVEEEWTPLTPESILRPDASNLKSFLSRLFSSGSAKVDLIKKHVMSAFPEIDDIIMPTESAATLKGNVGSTAPLTDIKFKFKYFKPEKPIDAISLKNSGTGIEQYLSIISAIITAEEPCIFLIDEPHAFLHPFAEKKLLEVIEQYSQHQYVISTHSPIILNSVPSASIKLLKRNEKDGSVICTDYDINETISELGLIPSDLWFYNKILFVEGPTEEKIIPIILRKSFNDTKLRNIKIADLNDQASAIRGSRVKKLLHEMIRLTIEAVNPFKDEFAIDYLILLDSEKLKDGDIKSLISKSGNKIIFCDKSEIENYLLDFRAVCKILKEECKKYDIVSPEDGEIKLKFEALSAELEKGSDILKKLFSEYKLNYEKTIHGPMIASEIEPSNFGEFKSKLDSFIG